MTGRRDGAIDDGRRGRPGRSGPDRDPSGRSRFSSRRGFLALVGTTALAGCGGVPGLGGEQAPTIDGEALLAVVDGESPSVPETVPVAIGSEYPASATERIGVLLSSVPAPLDEEEVPNAAIREELAAMHDRAREALAEAEGARSAYERLQSLRHARGHAGELSAGWRAIDDGLTREALLEEAVPIRRDVRGLGDRVEYVGADPVRAVLVYEPIETGLARAAAHASIDRETLRMHRESPVSVGDVGGDLERARASLDDAAHLYDRYTASLPDDPALRSTLDSAVAALASRVDRRRRGLPAFDPDDPSGSVGREIDDTPAGWALRELYQRLSYTGRFEDERAAGHPAAAVLLAQEALAQIRAFAALHERVEGGDRLAVETAADVESIRTAAIGAIESARSGARYPGLVRRVATDLAARVEQTDRELADVGDGVEPRWIARDVGRYVVAGAMAEGLPAVSRRVASVLG